MPEASSPALAPAVDALERFYGPLPQPPDDPFGVYVWQVLGVQNTPARRDAAVAALRRLPALTPDALGRVPRGRLEAVLKLAGPFHEERRRALVAGADLFRRDPTIAARLRGSRLVAMRVARRVPHLGTAAAHWLLLFGGRHAVPAVDEAAARVVARLAPDTARVRQPFRHVRRAIRVAAGVDLARLRRASLYLSHHGRSTCLALAPHCAVCPLRPTCPSSRHGVGDTFDLGEGETQEGTGGSHALTRPDR